MKKTFVALAIAAVITVPFAASAAEREGKVTKWETTSRTVTFDDGSTYIFNETVKTDTMKEGARIRVTYDEKDGKFHATKYEILQ